MPIRVWNKHTRIRVDQNNSEYGLILRSEIDYVFKLYCFIKTFADWITSNDLRTWLA